MSDKPVEVIVYRNPLEHWYWNNLGEAWGFIALLAIAIYIVFWPFVFMWYYRMDRWAVPNTAHAFLLTLFWPITMPFIINERPY